MGGGGVGEIPFHNKCSVLLLEQESWQPSYTLYIKVLSKRQQLDREEATGPKPKRERKRNRGGYDQITNWY